MNMCIQIFVETVVFISLGWILRSGGAGYGRHIFNLIKKKPAKLFSKASTPFRGAIRSEQDFDCIAFVSALGTVAAIIRWVWVVSHCSQFFCAYWKICTQLRKGSVTLSGIHESEGKESPNNKFGE